MGNRTTIHEVGEGGSSRRRQGRSLRAVCGGPDPGAGHRPAACEGARTRALRLDHLHDQALCGGAREGGGGWPLRHPQRCRTREGTGLDVGRLPRYEGASIVVLVIRMKG
jgi:hypothetical protein